MSNNIQINKNDLTKNFLSIISKFTDSCAITLNPDNITSIVKDNNAKSQTILYIKYNCKIPITSPIKLNIGSVKKLNSIISCINEDVVDLIYDKNSIQYKSDLIKFKYHLLAEGIMKDSSLLSEEKINSFKFNTTFKLNESDISNIIRTTSFLPENDRIYFYTDDSSVYTELGQRDQSNTDNVTLKIGGFSGDKFEEASSISIDIIRNLTSFRDSDITVNYNSDRGVYIFNIQTNNTTIKYITAKYAENTNV